jgi:YfiR/HmsC-like
MASHLHRNLILAFCLLACGFAEARAADGAYAEYEVKAAMVYNFTRFVEWPNQSFKDDRAALVIGVLGSDPFGHALDEALRDKQYGARAIQVKRLKKVGDAEGCHILFIARSERAHLAATLAALRTAPVLTISDMEGFSQSGGAIELTLDGNRVRFEINQGSAQTAGLTISSKLLKLAARVRQEGGA